MKDKLSARAAELGLSLSSYIRMKLMETENEN